MAAYSEQLAERKRAAADTEAELVAHFGPDANNCANWDDLWQRNWLRILTNSSISKLPDTLPSTGGWVSENGRQAGADPPSLYSDKFLFYFARQLADDRTELVVRANKLLTRADEMDCDLFTQAIETITVCLNSPALHVILGSGHSTEMKPITAPQIEELFRSWERKDEAGGVCVNRWGIAIPGHRAVPAEVAVRKLQAVSRQIEARQQQLQATSERDATSSEPTQPKATREKRPAKLAQGTEPAEVRRMLNGLGMGSTYDKPGEWAAAFRALWVAGLLTGNAPTVVRWAVQHLDTGKGMVETFKKVWTSEWSEASQFPNDAQKTVFRMVLIAAQRLVDTKSHGEV